MNDVDANRIESKIEEKKTKVDYCNLSKFSFDIETCNKTMVINLIEVLFESNRFAISVSEDRTNRNGIRFLSDQKTGF